MSDLRLRRWQEITAASLFVGYAGYYLGRTCLSIATPLMVDAPSGHGLSIEQIGVLNSVGIAAYAVGKVINGVVVDYFGGRRMFLVGMVATVACTVAFGLSAAFPLFLGIWGANRFFQSMGWPALVKTASRWYPSGRQASVMGVLSLSFLFGDAIIRLYLGGIVAIGQKYPGTPLARLADWRAVFLIAAATLGVIVLVTALVLRGSPRDLGLEEPSANPNNVFGAAGQSAARVPFAALVLPLLESPVFWAICGINFGLTLVREAFNNWSPKFLKDVADLSSGNAGMASLVFPLAGGASAIIAGLLSDRFHGRHGRVVVPSLVLTTGLLYAMGVINVAGKPWLAMALIALTSFFLIGPYSYLSGVMALDLGGKRGSSTAAGLIDGVGYLGAIASGSGVAWVAKKYEWHGVFTSLAVACGLTLIFALAYLILSERVRAAGSRDELPEADNESIS
ncbi:MAG TPA: MFS transporter [Planctomycetaceae bacterium]|jgi:OPA family glycerol-3-phosphate transporter-like MFS transporter|nr:MFS transporter [Planctomycetaceae bacterium]